MDKCLLTMMIVVYFSIPAYAMYNPPSDVKPTKEDLNVANKLFNGLKWDTSKISEDIISLTIPKVVDKYIMAINQWDMEPDNYIKDGKVFYQGSEGS